MKKLKFSLPPPTSHSYLRFWKWLSHILNAIVFPSQRFKTLLPAYDMFSENCRLENSAVLQCIKYSVYTMYIVCMVCVLCVYVCILKEWLFIEDMES